MIAVHQLTKRYGDVVAVGGISFSVTPGSSPASSGRTAPASRPRCG